ncbi:hypothetical protein Hbl1158_04270 [Halobaculum sp. CBA1158]|uniref:hypothetical protein n=1 Tax=Halobaculum sp. CBA1158 TaxID=2904243 RepID=UPI001F3B219D|nr:hypothetical protein [Halobaculum sp. CBA1158]UIP00584.1 hypothetical protein Hbl1158_04270 [Halobaculum sp. CBA1158]
MSVRTPAGRIRYPLALLAVVVGVLLLESLLEVTLNRYVETGSMWLPTIGTFGETVSAYLLAVNLLSTFAIPAVAFYLGVRYARSV